jgi:hypothetical protein
MVAAYRAGHAAAEWERRKPAKPPRNGREMRSWAFGAILNDFVPGIGGIPASFMLTKYRHESHRGAFVVGWVDAMNGRDAQPKAGDKIVLDL